MIQDFRTAQPQSHEITTLKLIEPGHFLLDNGTPVYTIAAGTEDLIKLDLVFNAGSFYQNQPLVSNLTNKCLPEGTSGFTSKAIAETVDFYGAYLRTATDKDDARISLYCLGKYFDKLLPVLSEVAFRPLFPDDEINTIIRKSKQEYLVNMEKVKFVAQINFNGLIFGQQHPYAMQLNEVAYDNLDRDQLSLFHNEFYAQRSFKIFVSGKLPENIKDQINHYFGQHLINESFQAKSIPDTKPSEQKFCLIPKEKALQSALRIGKVLFGKRHPDYIKMKVVSTILGGYFGSRLMTNIRENKGYTYGIGSSLTSLQHGGIFTIASEVGADVRKKAVDEIFEEIEKLRTSLVPENELNLVKNYLLGSFLRSADGPFALSELVKSVVDYNFGMDYFDQFLTTTKNITTNEIRELAVKYLDPASMITLVAGK